MILKTLITWLLLMQKHVSSNILQTCEWTRNTGESLLSPRCDLAQEPRSMMQALCTLSQCGERLCEVIWKWSQGLMCYRADMNMWLMDRQMHRQTVSCAVCGRHNWAFVLGKTCLPSPKSSLKGVNSGSTVLVLVHIKIVSTKIICSHFLCLKWVGGV